MDDQPSGADDLELIGRAAGGDQSALAELIGRHRDRLERMFRDRLQRVMQGRVAPNDVLPGIYLDLAQQLPHDPGPEAMPVFLRFRLPTGPRLARVHRRLPGTAGREGPARRGDGGEADSASMADFLAGRLTTAGRAPHRARRAQLVRRAIDALVPLDREIISLCTPEGLTHNEAAALGPAEAAASQRCARAMTRLQAAPQEIPGPIDDTRA